MSNRVKLHGVVLAVLAGMLLAGSAALHAAERKTLEGTLTDAMCGVKHGMANMSAAECTNQCVEMGSQYALVVGSDVFELEGKSNELKALAGQKVKLTGNVEGKTIQVESVSKG